MDYLHYKGYAGSVEYSGEDNCLFGKVLGMQKNCITYEGTTLAELKTDFENGVDDYLNYCAASHILPAKPIDIPTAIHRRVAFPAINKRKSTTKDSHKRTTNAGVMAMV